MSSLFVFRCIRTCAVRSCAGAVAVIISVAVALVPPNFFFGDRLQCGEG
jgi:hypothetical protein